MKSTGPSSSISRYLSRSRSVLAALLSAALLSACGEGLQLTKINSASDKPNNVWVFFTVKRGGEPVGNLQASDFKIYEDDGLVSQYESKQVILNPQVAAVMYTLLLLDVSGSITESGKLDELVNAAEMFIQRVGKTQKVAVYAFDGDEKLHAVVPFTETEGTLKGGLDGLRKYKPKDPSTNLHGAVIQGMRELQQGLAREKQPLKFGTLVVFSDGADRAARHTRKEMVAELEKKEYASYDTFAIGIGPEEELAKAQLTDIGRSGTEQGNDRTKVKDAFEKIAGRIEAHSKRFYLLSYCTPARKGEHKVRIVAETKEPANSGSLEYTFKADGFGPPPDCDPERKPRFNLEDVEQGSTEDGKGKAEAAGSGGASLKARGGFKASGEVKAK